MIKNGFTTNCPPDIYNYSCTLQVRKQSTHSFFYFLKLSFLLFFLSFSFLLTLLPFPSFCKFLYYPFKVQSFLYGWRFPLNDQSEPGAGEEEVAKYWQFVCISHLICFHSLFGFPYLKSISGSFCSLRADIFNLKLLLEIYAIYVI